MRAHPVISTAHALWSRIEFFPLICYNCSSVTVNNRFCTVPLNRGTDTRNFVINSDYGVSVLVFRRGWVGV